MKKCTGVFLPALIIPALLVFACDENKNTGTRTVYYSVTRAETFDPAEANGDFTISPALAAANTEITLTPAPDDNYKFDGWTFTPDTLTAGETTPGSGIYTFRMPAEDVTVSAAFMYDYPAAVPGTGVKTITVPGGMGKLPAYSNSPNNANGGEMYDGTRDITVTVTMEDGAITNVVFEHSIEWKTWYITLHQHGNLRNNAAALVTAIRNAKSADAPYTPNSYTGDALSAWNQYDTSIRQAVRDAVTAINAGKPNRTLEGGGLADETKIPWTADGVPLSGTAAATGSGFMTGSVGPSGGDNSPTDMKVTVTVAGGIITDISVESDDTKCNYNADGRTIAASFPYWIGLMQDANDLAAVDAITGATENATPYKWISLRFLRQISERAFNKIVNEY